MHFSKKLFAIWGSACIHEPIFAISICINILQTSLWCVWVDVKSSHFMFACHNAHLRCDRVLNRFHSSWAGTIARCTQATHNDGMNVNIISKNPFSIHSPAASQEWTEKYENHYYLFSCWHVFRLSVICQICIVCLNYNLNHKKGIIQLPKRWKDSIVLSFVFYCCWI